MDSKDPSIRSAIAREPEDGSLEHQQLDEKDDHPVAALELSRTLSRVASRLTTRHLTDPGPPPDGGVKAWTQVAMAWLVIITSWGYLNSFGVFQTFVN